MGEPTLALLEYLRKAGVDMDTDFLREGIQLLTKLPVELEVTHPDRLRARSEHPASRRFGASDGLEWHR